MYSKQNIWDLVRGFEWLEILGFTVLIYIVRLNWRWLMMHERSMKKEPWPKSHKWRCFKHFHGFKNRLAWAKTVRIFTKGGLQQLSAQAQQVSRIEQQDYTGHGKPFTMGTKYWNPWDLNSKWLHCNPVLHTVEDGNSFSSSSLSKKWNIFSNLFQ